MISKRKGRVAFLFLLSCAGAAMAQQEEAAVAVKTDGLPLHVAARVEQKAAQGITALRQYVWISRGVNQLDLHSLLREEEPVRAASAGRGDAPQALAALDDQR
ncbi:MAG TPA: hypothetical protein VFE23_16570 [Usitatibacter sp.]|nr:hypothetical protein [Usitatibacter sp.]